MTSYITITDAETDPEAPLTATLAKKWRDNPIAIAEADASVPANLRPTVSLGTLTTTSGTSQTLSGLTLTPYKFLVVSMDYSFNTGYGAGGTTGSTLFNGTILAGGSVTNTVYTVKGIITVDLDRGFSILQASTYQGTTFQTSLDTFKLLTTPITNSTTSISVSTSGTGAVLAGGNVKFYGVK